jgi:predicted small lipoprotein YifL
LLDKGRPRPALGRLAALALVALTLTACGQRGPLYFPDEPARKTTR